MAELRISASYPLGDIQQLGQEVDGTLYGFKLDGSIVSNKALPIKLGDYSPLSDLNNWKEVDPLIASEVSSFGVRSRIGVGLYEFHVDPTRESSRVRTPLRRSVGSPPPTSLTIADSDYEIDYSFSSPILEEYESYRIVFREGPQSYEFVVYSPTGTLKKPFGMRGEYEVTVRGHRYEVQELSEWSEAVVALITARPDSEVEEENGAGNETGNETGNASVATQSVLLLADNWEDDEIVVEVDGVAEDTVVFISPKPEAQKEYSRAGIYCIEQREGFLVFVRSDDTDWDLELGIVMFGAVT